MLEPLKDRIHYPRKALLLRLARALGGERLLLRLARLCYHLQVEGGDRIPRQGGCLVAFNHVSNIADGLIYLVVRRRRPDVHLYSWDLTGDVIAGLLGAFGYPQPEQGLLLAHKRHTLSVSALLQARQILATGGCVMIAPEGEITWDGRLQHPLAPGAAWGRLIKYG
jgi:1-acyl-sn-glycerol-3-phosphate acyltransferase